MPRRWKASRRLADDAGVHDRLAAIRRANKVALARLVAEKLDIRLDPEAMFDVQIKRFHEYKRQLLNILETVALYCSIRSHPTFDWVPRVKIFAGKAAAGYQRAKLIIKLINDVARVINADPAMRGLLKVVFLPDYNVSLAEAIIPASDLSEQISTAGMEASGTGNMKLALNGALTIGTLDGANIEIRDRVGAENIFIFGLTAAQATSRRQHGPGAAEALAGSAALRDVLDLVGNGAFSPDDPGRFHDLVEELSGADHFLVTADFAAYAAMQREVATRWHDRPAWWRSSVLNTAQVRLVLRRPRHPRVRRRHLEGLTKPLPLAGEEGAQRQVRVPRTARCPSRPQLPRHSPNSPTKPRLNRPCQAGQICCLSPAQPAERKRWQPTYRT